MSNLQQCRVERVERDFTVLSNRIVRDKNISLKAKGLFLVVMSLNESNWDFSINGLCKIVKEGRSAIYTAIEELKDAGYCTYTQTRDESGQLGEAQYTFYEIPIPCDEKPHTDFLDTENQTQLNTESNKTTKDKTLSQKFDFRASVIELGVRPSVVDDWLAVRKIKRAANTQTAFSILVREVEKACNLYPLATPELLVKIAADRNWMGIKCEFFRTVNFADYEEEQPKEERQPKQLPLFDDNGEWQS